MTRTMLNVNNTLHNLRHYFGMWLRPRLAESYSIQLQEMPLGQPLMWQGFSKYLANVAQHLAPN